MQNDGFAMAKILHRVERLLELSMAVLCHVEIQQLFFGTGRGVWKKFEPFDPFVLPRAFDVGVFDGKVDEVAGNRSLEFLQL
jgi:hypothetical protein